jgi:GTP-binding protein
MGMPLAVVAPGGAVRQVKLTNLMVSAGLGKSEVQEAIAGDIAAFAGMPDVTIGDTLADAEHPEALLPILIEKPTVKMVFSVNNSPFAGKEGQYCTSRNLKDRLARELDNDVALRVEDGASADEFVVSGRGELHLAILIEKMRREGYELQVSRPEVIMEDREGKPYEPAEDVWVEVPEAYSGVVIEKLSRRKGEMRNMSVENGIASLHFFVPTRGLIGFRNEFIIDTKGKGIINALFAGYFPKWETIDAGAHGSLVVHESGVTTAYGLLNSRDRGVLFIGPGAQVYAGQVCGEHAKTNDLSVNVCRQKQLNNFRAKTEAVSDDLIPPRLMSLEQSLEYIGDDELVEATPKSIRIRKRELGGSGRKPS